MPHEIIGEVVGQAVQGAAEVAADQVHKNFGWKGCVLTLAAIIGIPVGLYFLLR